MTIRIFSWLFPLMLLVAAFCFARLVFSALQKGKVAAKWVMIDEREQPTGFWVLTTLYATAAVLSLLGAIILIGTLVGVVSMQSS